MLAFIQCLPYGMSFIYACMCVKAALTEKKKKEKKKVTMFAIKTRYVETRKMGTLMVGNFIS